MTEAPQASTSPQLVLTHAKFVADIAEALRHEITRSIPFFLAPLASDLKDLKDQSASILRDYDKFYTAQALAATREAAVKDEKPFKPALLGAELSGPAAAALLAVGGGKARAAAATAAARAAATAAAAAVSAEDQLTTAPSSPEDRAEERAEEVCNPVEAYPGSNDCGRISQTAGTIAALMHQSVSASVPSEFALEEGCANGPCQDVSAKPTNDVSAKPTHDMFDMDVQMGGRPLVEPAGAPDDRSAPRQQGLFGWLCCRNPCSQRTLEPNGAYHLTPRYDALVDPVSDNEKDDDSEQIVDPDAAERLPQEISDLEAKVATVRENLQEVDALWQNRRMPYEEDVANICQEIQKLEADLELARMPKTQEPAAPGPLALRFVDSEAFTAVCNIVVLLNLTTMVLATKYKSYSSTFKALDQVFLAWYVIELSTKAIYYQRSLILGKVSVVWWNWMDLGIVVSGVVDQWLLPLLEAMSNGGRLDIDVSALRMLRILRLFRIMRFLKIIKASLKSDFAWTESATFEWCMACVIAFNSIIMSLELDIQWAGWMYVENFLQFAYTFELCARLKRQGCGFFMDVENMVWNYLDLIMVCGGALDLWLVPLITTLQGLFMDIEPTNQSSSLSTTLRILKIMRILRVLRLVRLLKMVKPLYRLLIGVIASMRAMQWVMVLTLLMLYACSIVFTNLVGKGLLTDSAVSDSAFDFFGSVPKSLFSLFKLMNGDMSVVQPITGSVTGQLLFAGFMVVSNWAILAVLTAVVSENMISTSQSADQEDQEKHIAEENSKRMRRLTALFKEIDTDGGGTISSMEWQRMMEDSWLHRELCNATGLQRADLIDYFECLAKDPKQEERFKVRSLYGTDLHLDYKTFIEALNDQHTVADHKSMMHVTKFLRVLESSVKSEFDKIEEPLFKTRLSK